MTVKSVLSLSAANMGREDLVAAVCDCGGTPEGELKSLLRCYNLVENEIALDYFPLKVEETLERSGSVLPYTRFSKAPVEVLSVFDESGLSLKFEVRPSRLLLQERSEGASLKVVYTYAPTEKLFTDDCEIADNVSARLLSFGVVMEYMLTNGQYAEAATWEKKYREALRAASARRRPIFIRSRRWI